MEPSGLVPSGSAAQRVARLLGAASATHRCWCRSVVGAGSVCA